MRRGGVTLAVAALPRATKIFGAGGPFADPEETGGHR